MNIPISILRIEYVSRNIQTKEMLGPDSFTRKFSESIKREMIQKSRKWKGRKYCATHNMRFPLL